MNPSNMYGQTTLANEEFVACWTLVFLDGTMHFPDMVSEVTLPEERSTDITRSLGLYDLLVTVNTEDVISETSPGTEHLITLLTFNLRPLYPLVNVTDMTSERILIKKHLPTLSTL